jgi:pimeloyl-ACP methyl ester carboxylesterase
MPFGENLPPGKRTFLQLVMALFALLILTALVGAVYQFAESKVDIAKHPAPGRLVDVGGYRLHLFCMGRGSPTVIFEAGLADDSLTWSAVQPTIAKTTRTCSYDRAGYGWSDSGPGTRDATTIAEELHTLLKNADVNGPLILVGHSVGGMYVREYAALYRPEVNGMVLVDSSVPYQYKRMDPAIERGNDEFLRKQGYFEDTMPFGWPRLSGWCDHWPAAERELRRTTECKLEPWRTHLREYRAFDENSAEVLQTGSLGNIPLIVLTAGKTTINDPPNSFGAMQKELVNLSTRGSQVFVEGGHGIQVEHPDAVIDAVLKVIAEVKHPPGDKASIE